jgi:integrase
MTAAASPFDNDKIMAALSAPGRRVEIFDADPRFEGLAVRVSPPGPKTRTSLKSWTFTFPWQGKRVRFTFGQYPALRTKAARDRALGFRTMLAASPPVDPRTTGRRDDDEDKPPETVAELIDRYVAMKKAEPDPIRTIDNLERSLRVDVGKVIGSVSLATLSVRDLNKITDAKIRAGSHSAAAKVFAFMRSMLVWAVGRGWLASNPLEQTKPPKVDTPQTYAMLPNEIAPFWHGLEKALPADHPEYAKILRFCLATGCRLNEAAEIDLEKVWTRKDGTTFQEIDRINKCWTLPKERSKNKRENQSPLSSLALELLGNEPRFPWGGRPVVAQKVANAFSNGRAAKRLGINEKTTVHAIRRTVATQVVERLKFGWHIGEAILHHTPQGVTADYIKTDFYETRIEALDAWANWIRELIEK